MPMDAREASPSLGPPPSLSAVSNIITPTTTSAPTIASTEASTSQCLKDVQSYIASELAVQQEEWLFVDKCNTTLKARYARLSQRSDIVTHAVEEARKLMERLPQYYGKIDELDRSLDALELVANGLDTYSKVLEQKFVTGTSEAPAVRSA